MRWRQPVMEEFDKSRDSSTAVLMLFFAGDMCRMCRNGLLLDESSNFSRLSKWHQKDYFFCSWSIWIKSYLIPSDPHRVKPFDNFKKKSFFISFANPSIRFESCDAMNQDPKFLHLYDWPWFNANAMSKACGSK